MTNMVIVAGDEGLMELLTRRALSNLNDALSSSVAAITHQLREHPADALDWQAAGAISCLHNEPEDFDDISWRQWLRDFRVRFGTQAMQVDEEMYQLQIDLECFVVYRHFLRSVDDDGSSDPRRMMANSFLDLALT